MASHAEAEFEAAAEVPAASNGLPPPLVLPFEVCALPADDEVDEAVDFAVEDDADVAAGDEVVPATSAVVVVDTTEDVLDSLDVLTVDDTGALLDIVLDSTTALDVT
nr:hypothetical protein B0A51_03681 [Rachicladosporium sp. CCFEE 5018]